MKKLHDIFSDERGAMSSKRILGAFVILFVLAMTGVACFNSNWAPEYVYSTICVLGGALIGLSTVDKFSQKGNDKRKDVNSDGITDP